MLVFPWHWVARFVFPVVIYIICQNGRFNDCKFQDIVTEMGEVDAGVPMSQELHLASQEQATDIYTRYDFKNLRTQQMPIDGFKIEVSTVSLKTLAACFY